MLTTFLSRWMPLLILSVLVIGLAWANYLPGSMLSGWDNIHSEYDLELSWQRALSGAWLENWGVGTGSGMAYAAELPRLIIYSFLSLFTPIGVMRYVWVFLMLWAGIVGAYYLFKQMTHGTWAAFIGALVYLFNLATVQYFYTPFISFVGFYGLLPWLLLGFSRFMSSSRRLHWLILGLASFFMGQAFFVPTMFLVTVLVLLVISGGFMRKNLQRLLLAWVVFIGVNLYWLLPFAFFTLTNSQVVVNSKINALSTADTQYMNKAYSGIMDIALLKGFWFSYTDFVGNSDFQVVMGEWSTQVEGPFVILWLGVFLLSLGGVLAAVIKRNRWGYVLLGLFLVTLAMLTSGDFFADRIPLFGQVFRSAFTKWSVVLALVYAAGSALLITRLGRFANILGLVVVGMLLMIFWPMFRGDLIYDRLQVAVPQEYFDLFAYLKNQPVERRIVHLPLPWHWGWTNYDWGYRGSGFLWYGIKQPIMDRAFDVWSPYNETFYHELSSAFYGTDVRGDEVATNVGKVFTKYHVSYALLDEHMIVPSGTQDQLRIQLIQATMNKLGKPIFQSGKLTLWDISDSDQGFVNVSTNWREIDASMLYGRKDPWFEQAKPYIQSRHGTIYPFAGLLSEKIPIKVDNSVATIQLGWVESGGTLHIPVLPHGTRFAGRVKVHFEANEIILQLLPLGEFTIGDKRYPLWLDQEWKVQLTTPLQEVVVGINNANQSIKLGETVELKDIPVVVGNSIDVRVFDVATKQMLTTSRLGTLSKNTLLQHPYTDKMTCIGVESPNYTCLDENNGYVLTQEEGIHWFDFYGVETKEPLAITAYQQIAHTQMDPANWELVKYLWDDVSPGSVSFSMPVDSATVSLDREGDNCDVLKRGEVEKKQLHVGVLYAAFGNGSLCEGYAIPAKGDRLNQMIVRLKGENMNGRALKASFYSDVQHRTTVEALLPKGVFDDYFLLLPLNATETYSSTLETRSFGAITSRNVVTLVESFTMPITWLQRVSIEQSPKHFQGNYQAISVRKQANWKYETILEGQGDGLLVLHQGYDAGWVGFNGWNKLNHVKVNGWANGWIITPAEDESLTSEIVVFYWPQLLQWFGLGLVGVGVVLLLVKRKSLGGI